jgi:isocitrate dehydrogenase (NAD+)
MLRHLGDTDAADHLEAAVNLAGKDVTHDLKPHRDDPSAVGTQEMAAAICAKLQ